MSPARRLYLDLHYWILLARVRTGVSRDRLDTAALEALRHGVATHQLVVPLAASHYMEMFRIRDPAQRAAIALTMDELSNYAALTHREALLRHETRAALARMLGGRYDAPAPSVLGYGFGHAFGQGTITGRIGGSPEALEQYASAHVDEVIERAAKLAGYGWSFNAAPDATAVERLHGVADRLTQFRMLRGPDDDDLPGLVGLGYNPDASFAVASSMQKREAELARLLRADPVPARRLREYVSARALYWDLNADWQAALTDVGLQSLTPEGIGRERLHQIVNEIPIIDVETTVRWRRFRNLANGWTTNDLYDISFVGQAVVYCDAILTDKDLRANIVLTHLDRKYGSTALRSSRDLITWLHETHIA